MLDKFFRALDTLSKLTVVGLVAGTIYLFVVYWQAMTTVAGWPR